MTQKEITKRNRQNARKSTGPRTGSGKAAAAQNAGQHGATAQPELAAVRAWLSVILDRPDITFSDLMPGDEHGIRALALARAEAQVVAAEQALRDFEDTAVSPSEPVPGNISDITTKLRDLSGHVRRSKEMQLNTALLRMLRHTEREERVLGRGRHKLLMRYAREARSRRRSALTAWLEMVREVPVTA